MKEKEFIKTIKEILDSKYIGDDCAYLKDLNIVVTQDSLIDDVHFLQKYITPFQLGWKSVAVNISDVCASGARPMYLTISLSLPSDTDENFIKEFYEGAKACAGDVKIVGGDITGADKIFISVCAIGLSEGRKISSRSHAKSGYKIIVSGEHGNSAMGFEILQKKSVEKNEMFVNAHLMPQPQIEFSKSIACHADFDYAMMDTSDGLADALMQIAKSSNVQINIDTSKIPHNKIVDMQKVLYGGEDYQLVAAVPKDFKTNYPTIGYVEKGECGITIDGKFLSDIDNKIYNHFEEKNDKN